METNDMPGKAVEVTPSDSVENVCYGLYIGTGGDVAVLMVGDSTPITHKNVPDGTFMPIAVKKIMSTNTDASDIIGYKR